METLRFSGFVYFLIQKNNFKNKQKRQICFFPLNTQEDTKKDHELQLRIITKMSSNKENEAEPSHSNPHEHQNENDAKPTKIPSRRDSLGKGILKALKPLETGNSNALHLMQLPLRDRQVKDTSSTGKKSYRRRVSFAPEVTLHKIDLIQPIPQPEQRQPRRRETIAFAPHSSSFSLMSPERRISTEVAEEMMNDSIDIEKEDDDHVSSFPENNLLGFEIHQDEEEFTETIDMSISKDDTRVDSEEENTMELTKPLGEIQAGAQLSLPLETNPLFQSTQESQSTQSTEPSSGSQSVFGSIKSLFDYEEEEEQESVAMDLTQPFNNPIKPQDPSLTHISENNDPDEAETTNDTTVEEAMDITSLAEGATERITMQNTLLNKQINDKEDISMEQTRIYGEINNKLDNSTQDITQSMNEITMEETRLFESGTTESADQSIPFTQVETASTHATPIKAVRSHTSEMGSPQSSKRKHQPDSEFASNDLRERINSLTPKKKRKSFLTIEKALEPAPLMHESFEKPSTHPHTSSQETHRVPFTPLSSSRVSLINSGKAQIGSFTETVPLAPSHEQDKEEDAAEYQPVTLERFLNDLSIEFFDDLNVDEDFTVDLRPIKNGDVANPVDLIIAKNSKLPWLELYSFSCDELQKNMNELKKLFDNLNEEFAEENPQLVRDYYETSGLVQQKKMNDRLLLMKTYSDKEAESAWYSWRFKLLDELSTRLHTNSAVLNEDVSILEKTLNEINGIQKNLVNEKNEVSSKLKQAMIRKQEVESEHTAELIRLRNELVTELTLLVEEEDRFNILEAEIQEIEAQEIDTLAIEEEISTKQFFIEKNSQEPVARLGSLLESFDKLQSISGIRLKSLEGTTLILELDGFDISLSVNLLQPTERRVEMSSKLPDITRSYINSFLQNNPTVSLPELIQSLKQICSSFKAIHNDLFYLNLDCPSKVDFNNGLKIEILDFNKNQKYKAKIIIRLEGSKMVNLKTLSNVETQLIYGSTELDGETILNNLKQRLQNNIIERIQSLSLVR